MEKVSRGKEIFEWLKVMCCITLVFLVVLFIVFVPQYTKSLQYQKVEITCDTGPTYVCYVLNTEIDLFREGELDIFKCSIKQIRNGGVVTYNHVYNIDVNTIRSILPIE